MTLILRTKLKTVIPTTNEHFWSIIVLQINKQMNKQTFTHTHTHTHTQFIYLSIYFKKFISLEQLPLKCSSSMNSEENNIAEFRIAFADYCRNCLAHFWNGCMAHNIVELWFRSIHLLHKHENTGQVWAPRSDVTDWTCHTANRILQLGNGHCVNLQGRSYDWVVSLASPWGGLWMRLLCTNF